MQNNTTHAEDLHVWRHITVASEVAAVVQERVHIAHERVAQDEVCYSSARGANAYDEQLTNSSAVRGRREYADAEVAAVFIDLDIRDVDGVHRIHTRAIEDPFSVKDRAVDQIRPQTYPKAMLTLIFASQGSV